VNLSISDLKRLVEQASPAAAAEKHFERFRKRYLIDNTKQKANKVKEVSAWVDIYEKDGEKGKWKGKKIGKARYLGGKKFLAWVEFENRNKEKLVPHKPGATKALKIPKTTPRAGGETEAGRGRKGAEKGPTAGTISFKINRIGEKTPDWKLWISYLADKGVLHMKMFEFKYVKDGDETTQKRGFAKTIDQAMGQAAAWFKSIGQPNQKHPLKALRVTYVDTAKRPRKPDLIRLYDDKNKLVMKFNDGLAKVKNILQKNFSNQLKAAVASQKEKPGVPGGVIMFGVKQAGGANSIYVKYFAMENFGNLLRPREAGKGGAQLNMKGEIVRGASYAKWAKIKYKRLETDHWIWYEKALPPSKMKGKKNIVRDPDVAIKNALKQAFAWYKKYSKNYPIKVVQLKGGEKIKLADRMDPSKQLKDPKAVLRDFWSILKKATTKEAAADVTGYGHVSLRGDRRK
jgi:hypothetical protein